MGEETLASRATPMGAATTTKLHSCLRRHRQPYLDRSFNDSMICHGRFVLICPDLEGSFNDLMICHGGFVLIASLPPPSFAICPMERLQPEKPTTKISPIPFTK